MLNTYKALLHGNRLEWTSEEPGVLQLERPIPVHVTILEDEGELGLQRGQRMAAALEQLAAMQAFADVIDPVAWEREMRQDRELPGRV